MRAGCRFPCSVLGLSLVVILSIRTANGDGPVRWKSNDAVYNFKQVFFGTSAELDCELTSPDVNVTFGIHQHDGSYADIAIDGKKYESRGRQVLKINHLTIDDAMEYACQADGVENKLVLFMVKERPKPSDFSISIHEEHEGKYPCRGRRADRRKIYCNAVGSGAVRLYRVEGANKEIISNVSTETGERGGHYLKKIIYNIANASKEDEGYYECHFDTLLGKRISNKLHLVVNDHPPLISSFNSKVVKEGGKVTLKCKTDKEGPPDTIRFYINGIPVVHPQFKSRYVTRCQRLKIAEALFPQDNVTFTCEIENQYGYDIRNTTVSILVPPKINKSVNAIVQRNTPVECAVMRSNPMADFTWHVQPYCHKLFKRCQPQKNLWRSIVEKDDIQIVSTYRHSQLLVPSHVKRDYFFRCVAKNSEGVDSHVIKFLHVREAKNPLQVVTKDSEVNERGKIQLTCTCQKDIFYKLFWLKDGKNISREASVSVDVESNHPIKSVMTINIARLADGGNYSCIGKDIRDETWQASTNVVVKEIFRPVVQLAAPRNVKEGDAVVLQCNVQSNPVSAISWYKDGMAIKVRDRNFFRGADQCPSSKNGYYFKLQNGKRSLFRLIICDVNFSKNNGTFMCNATNHLGHSASSASLNVLKKPFIEVEANIKVNKGDTVNAACKAVGNPKPIVYWRQKTAGIRMSSDNYTSSQLTIFKVEEKHFRLYECVAWNSVGNSTATVAIEMTNQMLAKSAIPLETTSNRRENLYILLAVSFVAIIVLIAVVFVLMRRRKIYGGFYLFSQPPDPDYLRDIDPRRALIEQTNGLPYDPVWEFPRKRIRLLDRLGSGVFGDVHLAEAVGIVCFEPRERASMRQRPLLIRKRSRSGSASSRSGNSYRRHVTKVAVKKLKENATPEEMRDLVSELKILIHIGEHRNIVNLLGACTKGGDKELLVILEYAPHGNLLSFLKNRRQMLKTTWKKETDGMENEITTCDLAVISYQVAKGMDFLASRRCVHRDLAARNVLVGEGYMMKIADFGLARDIYKDDRYVKLSSGLLPVKWMAIEALRERIFTHQSDVWSYGILLWEIMTMGGSPYPGLPVRDLLEALTSRYRMDKPIYCPEEIYGLMSDCWIEDPNDRPIFMEIVSRCAGIIEAHLTPEDSCKYLDPEHFTGDGYLRPIESPRSLNASLISPPPPYSAYINNRENKFFGSDMSMEDSCKKADYPDVVELGTMRHRSDSESKAKRDATQREKKTSSSSSSPENDFEDEADSAEAMLRFSLLNGKISYDKDCDRVEFCDSDKDVDETEVQRGLLLGEHEYINQVAHKHENPYLNA